MGKANPKRQLGLHFGDPFIYVYPVYTFYPIEYNTEEIEENPTLNSNETHLLLASHHLFRLRLGMEMSPSKSFSRESSPPARISIVYKCTEYTQGTEQKLSKVVS